MAVEYRSIFQKVESTLLQVGAENLPRETILANLELFKHFETRSLSDDDYFRLLVEVVFYSGFRATTVIARRDAILAHLGNYRIVANLDENKIRAILADPDMIRNETKVQACILNARQFRDVISQHRSFQAYIDSFSAKESPDALMRLRGDLQYRFAHLGRITSLHYLTEIGMPVLKPDRVIRRIFYRQGLLESEAEDEENLMAAVAEGMKFAQATSLPIRYIDIVFVAYGQVQSVEFGLTSGICLKDRPLCHLCGLKADCNYAARQLARVRSRVTQPIPASSVKGPAPKGANTVLIGPYQRNRIILCSGDASPNSQLAQPGIAARFFPRAKWVAAMRNAAQRLDCRFVILTTGHGLVGPETTIAPYDLHLHKARQQVQEIWNRTIPNLISSTTCDVVVFHAGGCPGDYADELWTILQRCGVSLFTFGQPNMVDIGKVDRIVNAMQTGAVLDELRVGLTYPNGLKFFAAK